MLFAAASQLSGNVPVGADLIAGASYGANKRPVIAGIDLAAKVVDVDVDIQGPDLFDDGRAADRVAGLTHKKFQKGKFLGA